MEEFINFPCFIVIVRKQSLVPFISLVWGSLRLAPIKLFNFEIQKCEQIFCVASYISTVLFSYARSCIAMIINFNKQLALSDELQKVHYSSNKRNTAKKAMQDKIFGYRVAKVTWKSRKIRLLKAYSAKTILSSL